VTWTVTLPDLAVAAQPLSPQDFEGSCPYAALVELPCGATYSGAESLQERQARILERAAEVLVHLLLPEHAPLTIGRRGDVELARGVADEHAELLRKNDSWGVRDLDGRMQTAVNARRIAAERAVPLREGDVLRLKDVELLLLDPRELYALAQHAASLGDPLRLPPEGVLLSSLLELEATAWIGPESGPFLLHVPVTGGSSADGDATLLVSPSSVHAKKRADDLESTRVYALTHDSELRFGRDSDCDLVLDESSVSREHGRLWVDAEGIRILDEHSPNGLWVGEERVLPGITRSVRIGQTVRVGRAMCVLVDWRRLRELGGRVANQIRTKSPCAA
jgi:pSer/pThr/pTyr-binding forkhead associated (FHA) protein